METPHSPRPTSKLIASLTAKLMLAIIRFYQYVISPMFAPRCRFYPTCSQYAIDAIKRHGSLKGGWLAFKRILRCHPFSEGGEDPVPPQCGCQPKSKDLH